MPNTLPLTVNILHIFIYRKSSKKWTTIPLTRQKNDVQVGFIPPPFLRSEIKNRRNWRLDTGLLKMICDSNHLRIVN